MDGTLREVYCSTEPQAMVALCAASLVLVSPMLIFLWLRLRAARRTLQFPQQRLIAWRFLWEVQLPDITGPMGPGMRTLVAIVGLVVVLLVIYAVGMPIVLVIAAFTIQCPIDPI